MESTEHFSILHAARADYVRDMGKTLELAHRQFYSAFSQAGFELTRSADRLVWVCFPEQSKFNEYARRVEGTDLSSLDGYYSTLTNRVCVVEPSPRAAWGARPGAHSNPVGRMGPAASAPSGEDILAMSADRTQMDLARLTHELAHQLAFNCGLQKQGVMYPFWVSEGLAANFEFDRLAGPGRTRHSTARRACLVRMYAAGELTPLQQFVAMTKAPADAFRSRQYYAQAWAFFRFLLAQRSANLRNYLYQLGTLAPGERSPDAMLREFTDAFGPLEGVERSWSEFLARQAKAQAAVGSAGRASGHATVRPPQNPLVLLPR